MLNNHEAIVRSLEAGHIDGVAATLHQHFGLTGSLLYHASPGVTSNAPVGTSIERTE
jgi:hypothetical protein